MTSDTAPSPQKACDHLFTGPGVRMRTWGNRFRPRKTAPMPEKVPTCIHCGLSEVMAAYLRSRRAGDRAALAAASAAILPSIPVRVYDTPVEVVRPALMDRYRRLEAVEAAARDYLHWHNNPWLDEDGGDDEGPALLHRLGQALGRLLPGAAS